MKVGAASACNALQTGFVADDEPCASVVDQLPVAQRLCDAGHTRTMHAEYTCNMLVSQLEFFAAASFMKRQQPTAKPLFDGVKRITHHPLRKLPDLTVDVIVQSHLQTLIGHHFSLEHIPGDRQSVSRYTDLHAICRTAEIECRGDSDRTFVSDYADLYRPAILEDLKLRHDGRLRKVDDVYLVILLVKVLVLGQVHSFDELSQPQKMLRIDKLQKRVGRSSKRDGIRTNGEGRDSTGLARFFR